MIFRVIIFLYLFIFALASQDVMCQSASDAELKDLRVSIIVENKSLWEVFERIIYDYDVVIGLEESSSDRDHNDYFFQTNVPYDEPKSNPDGTQFVTGTGVRTVVKDHLFTLKFSDAPLSEVMDVIVKQMKFYKWEFNNGVINIYPTEGRSRNIEKLMHMHVAEFQMPQGEPVDVAMARVTFLLPEFKAFAKSNQIDSTNSRMFPWYSKRPLPERMEFKNLTYRELLNAIARTKRGGWIVRYSKYKKADPDTEFLDIII